MIKIYELPVESVTGAKLFNTCYVSYRHRAEASIDLVLAQTLFI